MTSGFLDKGPLVFFRWANAPGWPVMEVSDNVAAVLGYDPDSLRGGTAPWASYVHPEDLGDLERAAEDFLGAGATDSFRAAYRVRHAGGRWLYVWEHCQLDEDGSFRGYVLDVTDIRESESRLADALAQLQETQRLLEDTCAVSRVGGWSLDLASGALHWTPVTREIHEVSASYPVTLANALSFYPEGENRRRITEAVDRALSSGEPYDLELSIITQSGRPRWIRTLGRVAYAQGHPRRLYGTLADIDDRKRAELALRASEAKREFVLEETGVGLWEWDLRNNEGSVSAHWKRALGYEPHEVSDTILQWGPLIHPEDRARTMARFLAFASEGRGLLELSFRLTARDGTWRYVLSRGRVVERDEGQRPALILGTHTDITEQRQSDEARYQRLVSQLREVVFRVDRKGRWSFLNPAWERLTGYTVSGTVGQRWLDAFHPEEQPWLLSSVEALRAGAQGAPLTGECRVTTALGATRWVHLQMDVDRLAGSDPLPDEAQGWVGSLQDVTEQRTDRERIHELAYRDTLTGLSNRQHFLEELEATAARTKSSGALAVLLLVDLDEFKKVNDTSGHHVGDVLLAQCAQRLAAVLPTTAHLARIGGDEFVVLLDAMATDAQQALQRGTAVARDVLAALERPFVVERSMGEDACTLEAHVTGSVGLTLVKPDLPADEALKQADLALYQAKRQGRNRLGTFAPSLQRSVERQVSLANDLRRALERGELVLDLQGKYTRDGVLTGAEALLRWHHPLRGLIYPGEFVPIAEETGLILPLGRRALELTCEVLRSWQDDPALRCLTVSLNVSAREFREPGFAEELRRRLHDHGSRVMLELTESTFVHDVEAVVAIMDDLRTLGVRFSMDDFGTGYSSLAYLKRLPLHELKIDRSFVRDIVHDPNDEQIILTILAMAETLGLSVVAEGVETEAQFQRLASARCPGFQGWWFHRPEAPADFASRARQHFNGTAVVNPTLDGSPTS